MYILGEGVLEVVSRWEFDPLRDIAPGMREVGNQPDHCPPAQPALEEWQVRQLKEKKLVPGSKSEVGVLPSPCAQALAQCSM